MRNGKGRAYRIYRTYGAYGTYTAEMHNQESPPSLSGRRAGFSMLSDYIFTISPPKQKVNTSSTMVARMPRNSPAQLMSFMPSQPLVQGPLEI